MSYTSCNLCARLCGVNREAGEAGYCRMGATPVIARAALHMWEEPIISGFRGSGTIFFSGCSLGCVFCQNSRISGGECGVAVTTERLCGIMLELWEQGAHNINLVTPTHFSPSIREAVLLAKKKGLNVPIVYNTGTYETREALAALEGVVDVYMPDLKYYRSETAGKYSAASDYPDVARAAIAEMVRQRGAPVIENGIMKSGVIVRILLLPGHVAEAKLSLKYLLDRYGDKIYVSLMSQYTPMKGQEPPLDRRVTHREYEELVDYAVKCGLKNGFIQEWGSAEESFIPRFDNTGVLK